MALGDGRFPQQKDCDPTKPEEHFLWALCQVPYSDRVTQPIQPNIVKAMSKHLHELGYRHHPQLQTKKLQMPHRGQQHYLNGMAVWVPMDTPDPEPVTLPDVKALTRAEQELLKGELKGVGLIPDPPKHLGTTAEITSWAAIRSDHVVKASEIIPQGGEDE